MRVIITGPFKDSVNNLMRKAGYIFLDKKDSGEVNFIRPFGRSGYPRFHVYLKSEDNNININLHLDQKKPVYKGASAHGGEYDGRVIDEEIKRIQEIIK